MRGWALQSVALRAVGGGVVAIASSGIWITLLDGLPALVAAAGVIILGLLTVFVGALGLLVRRVTRLARSAAWLRWVSLVLGALFAIAAFVVVPTAGAIVALVAALLGVLGFLVCGLILQELDRIDNPTFTPLDWQAPLGL